MQLNEARLVVNNNCGYVLKPMKMRAQKFHPYNPPDQIVSRIEIQVGYLNMNTKFIEYTYSC